MNGRCDECEIAAEQCHEWITVEFEATNFTATREFCRIECLASWSTFMADET